MALFGGSGDFAERISESFGKFGIKTERREKGSVKNTLRFDMSDTIHDSKYIALAVETPDGKNASSHWNDIIEKDLIPSAIALGEESAAALIIPSDDADMVIEMCRQKYLAPTVYQLFSGYVIAGFQKKDMIKLLSAHNKNTHEEKSENPAEEVPERTEKSADSEKKSDVKNHKAKETVQKQQGGKLTSPLGKKLAAAALLGITLGLMPLGAKTVMDKFSSEKEQQSKGTAAKNADIEKYFDGIKNGSPLNMELLRYVASNPQLASDEIESLADTPVGVEAAKNPSAPESVIEAAANSEDEDTRAAAAENPSISEDALRRLSSDPSRKVRSAAARNPAIPKDVMETLASDEPDIRESLLENNMLSPEILDKIASNSAANCEFNKKLMANPCVARSVLEYNAANPDSCIRAGIAANPNTPPQVLLKLTDDPLPEVRQAAWKNAKIPREKISSIFKPNWMPDEKNIRLEEARKAALENPVTDKDTLRRAALMNPEKYANHVAKNHAAPSSLIKRLKTLSGGSGGLKKFISDAMDMKNDPKMLEQIKEMAKDYGGNPRIPLRKALNAGFIKNVYDPYRFIEDMRRLTNAAKGRQANNNDDDNQESLLKYLKAVPADKLSVRKYYMDNFNNMPERFSDLPLPDSVNTSAEKEQAALQTADAIVDDIMENVLPAFMPDKNGTAANKNYAPSAASSASAGNSSASGSENHGINAPYMPDDAPKWLFQNACERVDALQSMF